MPTKDDASVAVRLAAVQCLGEGLVKGLIAGLAVSAALVLLVRMVS